MFSSCAEQAYVTYLMGSGGSTRESVILHQLQLAVCLNQSHCLYLMLQWRGARPSHRLTMRYTSTRRVQKTQRCTTTPAKCRVHLATTSPALTMYTGVQRTELGATTSHVKVRCVKADN